MKVIECARVQQPDGGASTIILSGSENVKLQDGFYRAIHFSAKRGIEIACRLSVCLSVCPSVCDVGGSGSHRSEILETNCTDT